MIILCDILLIELHLSYIYIKNKVPVFLILKFTGGKTGSSQQDQLVVFSHIAKLNIFHFNFFMLILLHGHFSLQLQMISDVRCIQMSKKELLLHTRWFPFEIAFVSWHLTTNDQIGRFDKTWFLCV